VGRAIPEWVFVLVDDPAPAIDVQPLGGNGRAGDVAAQAFKALLHMPQNPGNQCRLFDTGNDPQLPATIGTGLDVDKVN
jgi:hypothetical protein